MILAGDIGGTNARLAYFQPQNGHLRLISERVFPSREYSELGEIVSKFLEDSATRPEIACFGIAGPVQNGRVETSNLPWIIEQSRLAKQIRLPATLLINDLEANAWGIGALMPQDLVPLSRVPPAVGNQAVIAPGTGLGEAGLFWNGSQHQVFACEGGHTDFGPQGELQIELLRFLARSPLAEQALDLWISVYGAEAGNLALKAMATGGIFLGGGISPKILPKLKSPLFMKAFLDKGRLRPLLERIPVHVITNDKAGLLGAARCAATSRNGRAGIS